jgi:hypothetical protein
MKVNMRLRCTPLCLLGILWAACGDDAAPAANPDAANPDAADPDGAAPDGPGPEGEVLPAPETPITERPSLGIYQCAIASGRTVYSPRSWSWDPALVATAGGQAYVARHESTPGTSAAPGVTRFVVSTLGTDGALGPDLTEPAIPAEELGNLAAAPRGNGFALVWREANRLRFAAFDAAGAVAVSPRDLVSDLVSDLDGSVTPRLAAGPDGAFGMVFNRTIVPRQQAVFFMVVDGAGDVRLAPRRLDGAPTSLAPLDPAPVIVGGAQGYAMIWKGGIEGTEPGIDFARADAQGVETVASRRISAPLPSGTVIGATGFARTTHALVETAGGYLAAWSEGQRGTFDATVGVGSGGWMVVQLARLDPAGVPRGTPVSLRSPIEHIDEVEPSLVAFGDFIAASWSRGTHLYACPSCVPDHRIDLMLIDPATLTPVSNVVSLTRDPVKGGGLLRREVAVLGSSLLTTFDQRFHTYAIPASATFSCVR